VRVFHSEATALRADVDFVEELGATQLLHARVGSDAFVLQVPTGQIAPGTRQLALGVDAKNVHLFDPQTGERLGRREGLLEMASA
jgi:sn-glycerol 3-phosphate transport system ATP-binding protein